MITETSTDPWADLARLAAPHGRHKVSNNTYLQRDTDETGEYLLYTVVLHRTAILTFDPVQRTVVLNSGGHRTLLTKRRMCEWLAPFDRCVRSWHEDWYVSAIGSPSTFDAPYLDGMAVSL